LLLGINFQSPVFSSALFGRWRELGTCSRDLLGINISKTSSVKGMSVKGDVCQKLFSKGGIEREVQGNLFKVKKICSSKYVCRREKYIFKLFKEL